jgi:hypothetical protein
LAGALTLEQASARYRLAVPLLETWLAGAPVLRADPRREARVTGGLRIPATLEALPAWDRRQGSRLALPASNDLGGIDFVVVTDIGSRGARLVTPVPLPVGCEIRLKLPLLEPVHGSLVWVSSRLAGCEFLEPLILRSFAC